MKYPPQTNQPFKQTTRTLRRKGNPPQQTADPFQTPIQRTLQSQKEPKLYYSVIQEFSLIVFVWYTKKKNDQAL